MKGPRPESGRQLSAWLADPTNKPLVTVSGLPRSGRGKAGAFVAQLVAWSAEGIVVEPVDGTARATIPMPCGWMTASDAPDFIMNFDDRGFRVGATIRVTYLDDQDPFR